MDVYSFCEEYASEKILLRKCTKPDSHDLLKVYSDKLAVSLCNTDNCYGETFYYKTPEEMDKAIDYWDWEYNRRGFVRWSIIDKDTICTIGTIELFKRSAEDYFDSVGLLRIDLRSDYEKEAFIFELLKLILSFAYDTFSCDRIATKAVRSANERIAALRKSGFELSAFPLIGHDGTEYRDYFVRSRSTN
ncbi:MAG: GNAT family N-acetyltransferase [Oscillospiraceae bacterium]|nr:GNAT family N-acetyltransferase [Oscillospiraceae bacterium]